MTHNRFSITGRQGEIRWVYHRAALVTEWTLTLEGTAHRLSGTLDAVNQWQLSQGPLTFVVLRGAGPTWTMPITSLDINGVHFTATVQGDDHGAHSTAGNGLAAYQSG